MSKLVVFGSFSFFPSLFRWSNATKLHSQMVCTSSSPSSSSASMVALGVDERNSNAVKRWQYQMLSTHHCTWSVNWKNFFFGAATIECPPIWNGTFSSFLTAKKNGISSILHSHRATHTKIRKPTKNKREEGHDEIYVVVWEDSSSSSSSSALAATQWSKQMMVGVVWYGMVCVLSGKLISVRFLRIR